MERAIMEEQDMPASDWLDKFVFQQRHGKLNIRKIARVNLNQVIERVDIEALHGILENIAFCNIKVQDLEGLSDSMLVKTFRLAQLIIEYLINMENALHQEADTLKEQLAGLESEVNDLSQDNKIIADDNDNLRNQLRQKRKALATMEYVLTVHGPGGGTTRDIIAQTLKNSGDGNAANLRAAVCVSCGKAFSSREYLRKHCLRRKHLMQEDNENSDPNLAIPGSAVFSSKTQHNSDVVNELKKALEDALATRQQAVDAAGDAVRKQEKSIYEEQLGLLREESRLHEQKMESYFKEQLLEQKCAYEQRIAALEARLDVFQTLHATSSNSAITGKETERYRLERLEQQVLQHSSRSHQQDPKMEQQDDQRERSSVAYPMAPMKVGGYTHDTTKMFVRAVDHIWKTRNIARLGRAMGQWKVYTGAVRYTIEKVNLTRDIEEERIESGANLEKKPARAVAEHVAKFSDESVEHRPATEEAVRRITLRYLHAEKNNTITQEEKDAMGLIDEIIDKKASFVQGKYQYKSQPLDYAPLQTKPYIRSRWNLGSSEVHAHMSQLNEQLLQKMREFDDSLDPGQNTLDITQHSAVMEQLKRSHRLNPDKDFKKALKAVRGLSDELAANFYSHEDDEVDEEEFTYVQDELLKAAMIPIKDRTNWAEVPVPKRHSAVSSYGSEVSSASSLGGESEDEEDSSFRQSEQDDDGESDADRKLPEQITGLAVGGPASGSTQVVTESKEAPKSSPLPPPPTPVFESMPVEDLKPLSGLENKSDEGNAALRRDMDDRISLSGEEFEEEDYQDPDIPSEALSKAKPVDMDHFNNIEWDHTEEIPRNSRKDLGSQEDMECVDVSGEDLLVEEMG